MVKKVIIIGGVAGGASTAARLRRLDEELEIVILEKGKYISFANCGLPYYIGGVIEKRDSLLLQTPESFNARFNVDVRVEHEVIAIDREAKQLTIKNLIKGEEYLESYDKLVLSPGSMPLRPPIVGIDAPNIFTLWDIPNTDAIKAFLDQHKMKSVAVIGGGFIGIEMAESLAEHGLTVTIVEKMNQIMAPLDIEMAAILENHIEEKGLRLITADGVDHFEYQEAKTNAENNYTNIHLESGEVIAAEMILLSIGVRPQSELAKAAGLELNARGGIVTDPHMLTSDADIYALGDAVEVIDFNTKHKTMVPLAGPANKQGRIVADNIAGISSVYNGTQATSVVKVFDLTAASSGLNEKQLKANGKVYKEDYYTIIIHARNHVGYYPGASYMAIKLIFDKAGKVLGVQAVGLAGVDKRVDVVATVIRLGGSIYDLKELELAYAPPFGAAKDAVNMLGFVAENILTEKMEYINVTEFDDFDKSDIQLLDVRRDDEWEQGYIENAIHIPVNELRSRIAELEKDKTVLIYCAHGLRGYVATRMLVQHGFKRVVNLLGGYDSYKEYKKI